MNSNGSPHDTTLWVVAEECRGVRSTESLSPMVLIQWIVVAYTVHYMTDFPKLSLRRYPKVQERESSEARYWKSFALTRQIDLIGSPHCIHFNPSNGRQYAIAYSTRISLYDSLNDSVVRSYSRFQDDVYCGKFRQDGKLLLTSDKEGYVKVVDVQTKSILRQMKKHQSASRSCQWMSDHLHFISGGDDARLIYWDLALQQVLWENTSSHSDYIRCVDAHPSSANVFVSGSYDHSIRIWDTRQPHEIQVMPHADPISSCLIHPSGALLFVASGNEVKVWDMLGGFKLLQSFSNHQKNISNIAIDSTGSRLLSSGLDGHLKIYNLQTMKIAHGIRFDSPLLSVALSPSGNKLIVGHVSGTVHTHTRQVKPTQDVKTKHSSSGGRSFAKNEGVIVGKVDIHKSIRLRPYEKMLRSFEYQKALDSALRSDNPVVITSLIEELCRRSGLTIALSGRDEEGLQMLLSYGIRYISNPRYSHTITQVMHRILDLYGRDIAQLDSLFESLRKLQGQVRAETVFQRQLMRIMGSLDAIINSSALKAPRINAPQELVGE